MHETAIILGAGFSFCAGLPLTKDLFSRDKIPQFFSKAAADADLAVAAAYEKIGGKKRAEAWLLELYQGRENELQGMMNGTTWDDAVRYALRRLVKLPTGNKAPYYFGITTHKVHPTHKKFWDKIRAETSARCIISMNYDILVEQALHAEASGSRRSAPLCYYGGFQHTQVVRKMTNVAKREYELVELGHDFVLYKLHGSLNWAWERHSPSMKIHDDVRAVFRCDDSIGVPAIIPPIPEKQMPREFSRIWNEAEDSLIKCSHWIICGFSLPEYDEALLEFFRRILHQRERTLISIIDPYSVDIAGRWKNLSPNNIEVIALPGLPQALEGTIWRPRDILF